MDLKGKCDKYFVSGIGIAFQGTVLFNLGIALPFDHAVYFDDIGMIMHNQGGGGGCEVPPGDISESGHFMFLPDQSLIFFCPGKVIKSFQSFVH